MYIENPEFSRVLLMCTVLCTLIYLCQVAASVSFRVAVLRTLVLLRLFFYSLLLGSVSDPIPPSYAALCLGE